MSLSEQLVSYVLSAMISWIPLGNQYERAHDGTWLRDAHGYYVKEDTDEALARYKVTAQAIVDVALDPSNPPLFRGPHGEPDSLIGRVKTALQKAAIASYEGGFHKFVESGDCNTPAFHAKHEKECDGGAAWTNFQIHLYNYIIRGGEMYQSQYLEQSTSKDDREWIKEHKGEIITGKQLVSDPKLAAQVAYYIIRWSFKAVPGSLCGYTGESCTGAQPLARDRSNRPRTYFHNNPFIYVEEAPPPPDLLKPVLNMLLGLNSPPLFHQQLQLQLQLN
jgi:hypothetical protein